MTTQFDNLAHKLQIAVCPVNEAITKTVILHVKLRDTWCMMCLQIINQHCYDVVSPLIFPFYVLELIEVLKEMLVCTCLEELFHECL